MLGRHFKCESGKYHRFIYENGGNTKHCTYQKSFVPYPTCLIEYKQFKRLHAPSQRFETVKMEATAETANCQAERIISPEDGQIILSEL